MHTIFPSLFKQIFNVENGVIDDGRLAGYKNNVFLGGNQSLMKIVFS